MIFDTHTHYDDEAFDADREEVLLGLAAQGVGAVVNVGASMQGAIDSVALAKRYPFVYAAVGIHPDHAGELDEAAFERLAALTREKRVVAVGEIGFDYYWNKSSRETQRFWFGRQLALAVERGLPVIIHSREAAADTMDVLREAHARYGAALRGVIHCFSYSPEQAQDYVRMGFWIGIGGVATFRNGRKLKEVIDAVPTEHLVLETDCPYLAPEPHRGKRNTSAWLSYVVAELAAQKGLTAEEIERVTWENAEKLYGLAAGVPAPDGSD